MIFLGICHIFRDFPARNVDSKPRQLERGDCAEIPPGSCCLGFEISTSMLHLITSIFFVYRLLHYINYIVLYCIILYYMIWYYINIIYNNNIIYSIFSCHTFYYICNGLLYIYTYVIYINRTESEKQRCSLPKWQPFDLHSFVYLFQ